MDKQPSSPSDRVKASNLYYGYVVLAACFFIMTIVFGSQMSFGVFFKPMASEFGWNRAATSGPFSLNMAVSGIVSILAGKLCDRFGPRIIITIGGIVFGTGFFLMSRINALWQLYMLYGIVVACGSATMYVPLVSMLARWFARRRGLITGIGVSGIGFGIGVVPAIATQIMESYTWRVSVLVVGCFAMVMAVTLAQFLRARPETAVMNDIDKSPPVTGGFSFGQAIRLRQFWMILFAWWLYGFFFQVGIVHTVPYATDLGMTAMAAATLMTIIGIIGIFGRISLGLAGDKFSNKTTLSFSFTMVAAAFLGLLASRTTPALYVYAAIYGAFSGTGILLGPISSEYFGLKSMGAITGAFAAANNFGAAVSPTLAGYIYDTTGSYHLAFITCIAAAIAAAAVIWRLGVSRVRHDNAT